MLAPAGDGRGLGQDGEGGTREGGREGTGRADVRSRWGDWAGGGGGGRTLARPQQGSARAAPPQGLCSEAGSRPLRTWPQRVEEGWRRTLGAISTGEAGRQEPWVGPIQGGCSPERGRERVTEDAARTAGRVRRAHGVLGQLRATGMPEFMSASARGD